MNVERLEAVRDHILAHPEQFDMYHWHHQGRHCIAGLGVVLFGRWYERVFGGRLLSNNCGLWRAMEIFDINITQAYRLCFVTHWSDQKRAAQYEYSQWNRKARAARLAANQINAFIAQNRMKKAVKNRLVQNLDSVVVRENMQEIRGLVFHS